MFASIKSKFLADPKEVENRRKLQLIIGDSIEAINLSKEKVDGKRWLKVKFYPICEAKTPAFMPGMKRA